MTLEDHGPQTMPARPAMDGSDIRKIAGDDVPTVARALAQAFADDPVMSWIFRDETQRPARLERAFGLFMRRIWLPEGECYTTDRQIGAALWLPPGKWHLGVLAQLRLLPAMISVTGSNLPRLFTALNMIEKKHPKQPTHYYLAVLGVEPEHQGRGFGGALMQPVLGRCDRDRIPAYLESSKRRNIALYERHGFRVVEELKLPKDGPPIWRMWRDPLG